MELVAVLVGTVAACALLREPLQRWPGVFYALAVVFDVLFWAGCAGYVPWAVHRVLLLLARRGTLAFSLFAVVMFVGVLPRGSKVRGWFAPVRGELSIVACLVMLGHVVFYAASYAPRVFAGAIGSTLMAVSLLAACVMVVLMAVLGVTSVHAVRVRMNAGSWKKLQRLAYVFFGLAYAHLACALLPSALSGGAEAQASMVVYTVVFAAYVVLSVIRWRKDVAVR